MSNKPKKRESFTLRLQPYKGSPLASVVNYLESRETRDTKKLITEILLMCFLPLARLEEGERTPEELRRTCLESCDALEKHASYLRQVLGVEAPVRQLVSAPVEIVGGNGSLRKKKLIEPTIELPPSSFDSADTQANNSDIDSFFSSAFS
jgi:hypothetical protein